MNISAPFIKRPVGTALLTVALALAGCLGYKLLPVSPLPQIDFPTINVSANLPGASPETMASSVATPLERQFSRIAGVTEMTSSNNLGTTSVTLQFELNRDINGAARDVQAAINASRSQLPASLPRNPSYWKVNPADAPIMLLSLTSDTIETREIYDLAYSVLQQKISQVPGVGQVFVGGSSLPSVRVELNPYTVNKYGISLEQVRTALGSANANRPKGQLNNKDATWEIHASDQLLKANQYKSLIVTTRNGSVVRLSDLGEVTDSVENLRAGGLANGKPSILIIIFRQPGANIIETVDNVRGLLPLMQASISPSIKLAVLNDRTTTIRTSVKDVEVALLISIALVIMVVFIFLRSVWATMIPSVAVPLSLLGAFGVMYLLGYSIDNLSLMALTISTGFVVDDAIVVIENITRHLEHGMRPFDAAMLGARQIGFTVLSMSASLIAVFIPILLMGGIVGRLFREFAVTLSVAIAISLVVSLTATPMMCAKFLRSDERHGRIYRANERAFNWIQVIYGRALGWVLRHPQPMLLITILTICASIYLYVIAPKGFFPDQDTGRLTGNIQAAQDISFQDMRKKLKRVSEIVLSDPAVDTMSAYTGGGGGTTNTARMFISLKDKKERQVGANEVIARLRPELARVPGASTFLRPVQDINVGGRMSNAVYQYTLQSDNYADLAQWMPKLQARMRSIPLLTDLNTDQLDRGLEASLTVDRDTAARLGIDAQLIDNTLYDAFGQRQVSTMYMRLNQYHVVMEVAPQFWQSPETLRNLYIQPPSGAQVPLSAVASFKTNTTTLAVNHQGQFPAATISFNLAPGAALGSALEEIEKAKLDIGLPASIQATFQGTAKAFQSSLANMPLLILAALLTVYIVLGVLYESYIHPITILSTLPSAGVGAIMALLLFKTDLTVIALIGIILLIGIVKKNAIMMIDFALEAERDHGKDTKDAIYEACLLRFRPIMMTTMAALLGGLPLALGSGSGSEMRKPLGITIVGGLIVSQMLTLFTTPVVYMYMDKLSGLLKRKKERKLHDSIAAQLAESEPVLKGPVGSIPSRDEQPTLPK
ncbi:MAG: multidrug efflux RND transporter permease subunit [Chloracidobacterium sp.]|nr:multidrug efflux RND transporter permease subunit [Chloracidobacterium sp.]